MMGEIGFKHILIQSLQSKIHRKISIAPFYVSNQAIHSGVPFVLDYSIPWKFHEKLPSHPNPLTQILHSFHIPGNPTRLLSRQWPRDLLQVKWQKDLEYQWVLQSYPYCCIDHKCYLLSICVQLRQLYIFTLSTRIHTKLTELQKKINFSFEV